MLGEIIGYQHPLDSEGFTALKKPRLAAVFGK